MFNWALYGVLCVQTCRSSNCIVISGLPTNSCADVYSYNFPEDRRAIKFLGEYNKEILETKWFLLISHPTSILRLSH